MKKLILVALSLVCGICLAANEAVSLDYPTREIEFIAGFAPGSNTDLFARLAAKHAEKYVGKPIVVVNKAGGGGSLGFEMLAKAKPDGYTLGIISPSVVSRSHLMKGVTFNKDSFRIISQIDYSSEGFFVQKGSPYDIPFKEILKKCKEKPETIKMGIGGVWGTEDFARVIFEEGADVKFLKVAFPGSGKHIVALLGGHVDCIIGPAGLWAPLYKAGQVNVLAVSSAQRDPRFPEVPTFKELGYDMDIAVTHWVGGPAKLPEPIVDYLAAAFKKAFTEPAFVETSDKLGATAAWEGPEASMRNFDKVDRLFRMVIKKYDLKPE